MRGIRGADTEPELRVRRRMHAAGLRYRLHAKDLPGRPDIVLRPIRTAVFVNGCFWHGHQGCRFSASPSTHADFWATKLRENVARDLRTLGRLEAMDWNAVVVWECASDLEIDAAIASIQTRLTTWRSGHSEHR